MLKKLGYSWNRAHNALDDWYPSYGPITVELYMIDKSHEDYEEGEYETNEHTIKILKSFFETNKLTEFVILPTSSWSYISNRIYKINTGKFSHLTRNLKNSNERKNIKKLKQTIKNCCFGPSGNPIDDTLESATTILSVLIDEGADFSGLDDAIRVLKTDNICERNFLLDHGIVID